MVLGVAGWVLFYEDHPKGIETSLIEIAPWMILSTAIAFIIIYACVIYSLVTRRHPRNLQGKELRRQDNIVIVTCVSVVSIFLACSCPIPLEILLSQKSTYKTGILLVINAMLDPLVYFFKNYQEKKVKKKPEQR